MDIVLAEALYRANVEYREACGTPRAFDALCRWSAADYALAAYESKRLRLAELAAEVKRLKVVAA